MAKGYTQLSLFERRTIEEGLASRQSIGSIAWALGRARSTILREIMANRTPKTPRGKMPACPERYYCVRSAICDEGFCVTPGESCSRCKERDCRLFCNDFRSHGKKCTKLETSPYVCNGCKIQSACSVRSRWYYSASVADRSAKIRRSESRTGIDMDPGRAHMVLDQIRDAVGRGLSPYEISVAYAQQIGVSPSTIYRWVERGYGGMANIELERKVGFKRRKGHTRCKVTSHSLRRRYAAFCELDGDMRASACEMDTVLGCRGDDACVLTLYFRSCNLQLALLLSQKSQSEVIGALQMVLSVCSDPLRDALFSCVLTDNGSEFENERAIGQIFGERGSAHTRLYYCDVRASNQKGSCEKNHTELRQILRQGAFSFDDLTTRDMACVMSHANSNPRKALCGLSPIDMFIAAYGDDAADFLAGLGIQKIPADELVLKPSMLNIERAKRGEDPIEMLK